LFLRLDGILDGIEQISKDQIQKVLPLCHPRQYRLDFQQTVSVPLTQASDALDLCQRLLFVFEYLSLHSAPPVVEAVPAPIQHEVSKQVAFQPHGIAAPVGLEFKQHAITPCIANLQQHLDAFLV
jgi:hypothetical protein